MAKNPHGDENGNLNERLSNLEAKLEKANPGQGKNKKSSQPTEENTGSAKGTAQAFRLSSEFIAGVVVGAGIGYAVDVFFGTTPWGMIIFLMLGFCAAVLNILRASGMVAESELRLKAARELQNKQEDPGSEGGSQK